MVFWKIESQYLLQTKEECDRGKKASLTKLEKNMCDDEQLTENSSQEDVNENDVDIHAINVMSANNLKEEDEDYIETINNTFENSWHEINLGPEIMKDYIKYCQRGGNIPVFFLGG